MSPNEDKMDSTHDARAVKSSLHLVSHESDQFWSIIAFHGVKRMDAGKVSLPFANFLADITQITSENRSIGRTFRFNDMSDKLMKRIR